MSILGKDGKAYHNTGTFGSPTWDEITNLVDVDLSLETGSADVTTRGSGGWRQEVPTLKEAEVTSEMIYDTTDTDFTAIQTAFFAGTGIEMAFMDGDISTAGSQGLRATMGVSRFSRNEPLEDAMKVPTTFKPTDDTTPSWMTVSA